MPLNLVRKLMLNFGPSAFAALGLMQYARYAGVFATSLPEVAKTRDLKVLDRKMGAKRVTMRFMGARIAFDCPTIDGILKDGTYTFGIVRELCIRNVYLRHGVEERIKNAACVVDLGSNRGIFSAIAAGLGAKRVLSIEVVRAHVPAIEASYAAVGFSDYAIESAYLGGQGLTEAGEERPRFDELLDKHGIETIDVLKMDIEGSEFGLFEEDGWLRRVRSLCMEVHPEAGRVDDILERLEGAGFRWVVNDHTLRVPADHQRAEFIWAVRG
ncbi:MAG: FkbM family methyltransferase [Planctomycetota bacterium]